MRIALIASPFIPVPPVCYGGTELFIGHLAESLSQMGHDVVVYANGESKVQAELRWYYRESMWPPVGDFGETLKEITHTAWAIKDAADTCDVIHVNNTFGLPYSRFVKTPFVCTIHHPHEKALTEFYCQYPDAKYVTISKHSQRFEMMPNVRTIHHGINVSKYRLASRKEEYFSFLGRIVPVKGAHAAIEIAKRTGIPLKIAGEVQPIFRDYFEREIAPQIDGRFIEYVGEADFAVKNELLANSMALLFPIEWDEPFGLIMIEAMSCGTPVLAFSRGSVPEIVRDGVSGFSCNSLDEMLGKVPRLAKLDPAIIRRYTEEHFSVEKMASAYLKLYSAITQEVTPAEITGLADLDVIKLPAA